MVKIKMSTASNMSALYCALIMCTLVSTAPITTNTNSVVSNHTKFNPSEVTPDEKFEDWYRTKPQSTTQSTLFGTDLNDTMLGDKVNFVPLEEIIDDSQEPENNKNSSEKPISTNDQDQTTLTRMASTVKTTTSDNRNASEFNATEHTTFKNRTSMATTVKTMTSDNRNASEFNATEHTTFKYRTTEHRNTDYMYEPDLCKTALGQRYMIGCPGQTPRTRNTNMYGILYPEYYRWNQKKQWDETTMSEIELMKREPKEPMNDENICNYHFGKTYVKKCLEMQTTTMSMFAALEKAQQLNLQQKLLLMQSESVDAILDIFND